jgi:cytochrome c oxidase subunit 2
MNPSPGQSRQRYRLMSLVLLGLVPLLLAAAPSQNLNIFDPVSPPAREVRDLFLLVLFITGGIFLLVEGMLLYIIFRFRRRRDAPATEPPQIYGSKPIEIAWTVGPAIVVFVLFLVVVRSVDAIRKNEPPPGSLVVRVIGHQWWWEYQYPEDGFVTANELHVPVGREVYLRLESADVVHSFWVPRLAGKTDVIPGRINHMWFQAEEPGLFLGQCAEFCGNQHGNMLLRVYVDTEEEFNRWRAEQHKPAASDQAGDAAQGRQLFFNLACTNCHRISRTADDIQAALHISQQRNLRFGPDLTHLASRDTLASGIVPNDAATLHRWLKRPDSIKPGCWMPDMKLNDEQGRQLTEYLRSLR